MKSIKFILVFLAFPFLTFAQKPKIIATASMIADMAQNIVGDKHQVATIVPIGSDPHLYEPTPGDATMVANAAIVLKNSLTFEGWLEKLIDNSGTKAKVVTVTEGIDIIKSLKYENSADPHAWMSAANGLLYIKNIKNSIIEYDPANKDFYEKNFEKYAQKLKNLDQYIFQEVEKIPEQQRILITSHDAFQYYGRRYGIQLESILGTSTDAQAQTSDIVRLDKVIKKNNVPAVFIETTVNPKMLEGLAKSNDITIGGSLFSDSIGEKDSNAPTYYDMLKYNTDIIVQALSRETSKEEKIVKEPAFGNTLLYFILGTIFLGGFILVYKNLNKN